jgi:hypothetical protein
MFCPRCHAEYLPHILRCSDCDVPLSEHLPPTNHNSKSKQRSGFLVFKEWGLFIVLPIVFVVEAVDVIALRDNPFEIQIALVFVYSGFVFLFVFCDTRGWKGYSLGEKTVRQKLPLLLWIHAAFLLVIFAGVTEAILVHPHLSLFWTLERNKGGRGKFSNLSYFDHISILTFVAIMFTQTYICRGILCRAMKDEQGE